MSFEDGFVQTYSDINPIDIVDKDVSSEEGATEEVVDKQEREPLYNVRHTNSEIEEEPIYAEGDGEQEEEGSQEEELSTSGEEGDYAPSNHWEEQAYIKGWRPEEEYDGDSADWRTAREFVEKGELFNVIHSLKRDNKTMKESLVGQSDMIAQALEHGKNQAIDALKKQRSEAREVGEFDEADDLSEKIAELKAAKATVPSIEEEGSEDNLEEAPPRINDTERAEWVVKNPWFNTDKIAYNSAVLLSESYLQANPEATGQEILTYVDATMRTSRPDLYKNRAKGRPQSVTRSGRTIAKAKPAGEQLRNYRQLRSEHKHQADLYHQSTKLPKSQWIKDFAAVGGFDDYDK